MIVNKTNIVKEKQLYRLNQIVNNDSGKILGCDLNDNNRYLVVGSDDASLNPSLILIRSHKNEPCFTSYTGGADNTKFYFTNEVYDISFNTKEL
jgi:hypothetical protein